MTVSAGKRLKFQLSHDVPDHLLLKGDTLIAERGNPGPGDLVYEKIGSGYYLGECYRSRRVLRVRIYHAGSGTWSRSGAPVDPDREYWCVVGFYRDLLSDRDWKAVRDDLADAVAAHVLAAGAK